VLVAAFILFVPSLTLLGMVSPYAIRVKASSLNVVGRTAGDLYAISTVGSVISALLTGFILIPNVGVSRLTLMIGVMLLITATIGPVLEFKSKTRQLVVSIFLLYINVKGEFKKIAKNSGHSCQKSNNYNLSYKNSFLYRNNFPILNELKVCI